MEELDKGCPITRMGVGVWVFLLVPAYPGSPGSTAVKRLCVVCVCVFADLSEVLWARVHGASLSVPGRCCLSMFTDTEGRDCQADQSTHRRTHVSNRYIIHTHAHPFNGPLSGTTEVSRYQKGKKPIWILLKQETVSGSGISWAICKSAHRSRQITMPAPHHSVFYRPDALPVAQPAVSKHWRQ